VAASNFDTTKVRLGELVAAVSGAVLFISLFLDWYSVSAKGPLGGFSVGGSAWDALSFIPILLLICSIIAIGAAVMRMASVNPKLPVSPGLLLLGAGGLATLLVLYRIIDIPIDSGVPSSLVDVGRSFGIFIALIAALGIAAGGWITWNEEGRPKPNTAAVGAGAPQPGGYGQQPGGYAEQQAPAAAAPQAAAAAPATPPQQAAVPAPGVADAPPAGGAADWYPDPRGEKRLRYWDGSQWTHHVAD
jgi:hypothetical protein